MHVFLMLGVKDAAEPHLESLVPLLAGDRGTNDLFVQVPVHAPRAERHHQVQPQLRMGEEQLQEPAELPAREKDPVGEGVQHGFPYDRCFLQLPKNPERWGRDRVINLNV